MSIQAIFNIHLGSASIVGEVYVFFCCCSVYVSGACVGVFVCVHTPAGYAVLFESYLFVADSGNSYVQMLTTAGIFQRYIGKGVVSSLSLSVCLVRSISLSASSLCDN
jgi:hypothetical protein